MSYQVIARKWRPQTFADLVGQQHVSHTLENAIRTNRVAHAYIFSGARGVGKTTTARILAKALNCAEGPTPTPCNACDSCKEITAGTSLDVLEIDAASNRGIDQIRELREMVRYAPLSRRHRVVILDEAHMLTGEASNALLKTLEEPPPGVVFVLATTQPQDLEDTIRSRAQHFHFRALSFQEISDRIAEIARAEKLEIEPGALAVIARAAEGSVRDGLSVLEQAIAYCGTRLTDAQVRELLGVVAEEALDELLNAIASQSAEKALSLVHRLIAEGHNLQHFCREAIRHFRNLLVAKVCGADSELIAAPKEERPRLERQAEQFSEEDLTRFSQLLMHTDDDLRRKPDPRLHLEMGLLRLVNAARLAPLEEVLAAMSGESTARSGMRASGDTAGAARAASVEPARTGLASAPKPPRASLRAAATETAGASVESASPAPTRGVAVPMPPPSVTQAVADRNGISLAQEDAIKAAIAAQHKFLWSLVEPATRWEIEGSEVRLYFSTESRTIAEMLQARDPMERLRTISSQVMGRPVRVCVKLEASQPKAAPSSATRLSPEARRQFEQDPVVREMLRRFGGKVSGVQRPDEES
jgi:DNA polymerase-3 subunit gamma/tau